MKKLLLSLIGVIGGFFLIMTVWGKSEIGVVDNLFIANVEALTHGESQSGAGSEVVYSRTEEKGRTCMGVCDVVTYQKTTITDCPGQGALKCVPGTKTEPSFIANDSCRHKTTPPTPNFLFL